MMEPERTAWPGPALKIRGISGVAACALWLIQACTGVAQDPGFTIGVVAPSDEPLTLSLRQGAEMAAGEMNTLPGRNVRLLIKAQPGSENAGNVAASRLVLEDGVSGVVGSAGGVSVTPLLQLSGRMATPFVTLCPDTAVTSAGLPWVLQIVPSTLDESRAAFERLRGSPGRPTRWVCFAPADAAGQNAASDVRKAAFAAGCQIEAVVPVDLRATEFEGLAKRLAQRWPDGVLIRLDPVRAGKLAQALRSAGLTGFLAGAGWLRSGEFISAAGSAAEGFLVPVVAGASDTAAAREFTSRFETRYGRKPDETAGMAYDAVAVLTTLLRTAGSQPVADLMPPVGRENGVTGPLIFRRNGSREATLEMRVYHQGVLERLPQGTLPGSR
jgi:ABC-type branched-subunit amino acid transport system substrate-binding protein